MELQKIFSILVLNHVEHAKELNLSLVQAHLPAQVVMVQAFRQ